MDLVASKILKKFLKTFIESCSDWGTGDDVDITPSQGIVTLHDIAFIKDVFKEMVFLPSQLDVETATCSSIDVVVPWTQLYKKPIILRLGEVVVEAKDMSIDETTRRRKVRKPKKPKKKKSRELIDTILVELTLFKLVLKIGPSTLHLVIQGGETYFADEQFHKIKKIPEEKACDGIVYSYRFLQVNSLTLTFVNGERSANLCDGMEVVGRVTTQRDHDSYALLDTSVVVDLSTISLNLSMDDYINLVSYFQTLFGIATESAIIDVVNAAPSTSATPTPVLTPESDSPHRLPSMTQSQPIPTTKMSRPQSLSNSPITSSPSNKFMKPRPNSRLGSILTVETIGEKEAKKQEKAEKKAEKKLLKEEKKGDARLQFQIRIPFVKLSLKNEDTNEGLCWLIGETVVTFVPAYGGRIKEGWYGFDIKTIEGLYTHGEEIKRLIWGLEEDATQKTLSSRISTTWNRNILVGTKLTGELRFVGITMEFEMLKNLIEFLKVTVIDKISELSVDVLSIKEQIAKTIEDVKEKWEDALDILGLTSALDLLKRVGVDFTLYGCRFEGPFPDNGGNFVVEVDDVTITNEPHWTSLSVEKKVEKQLKHKLSIAPMTTPKSIRLNIALGTFSVAFFDDITDKTTKTYLFPPTRGDFQMQVHFDESATIPSLIQSRLAFKQIHFLLTGRKFKSLYKYFSLVKEYVKSKMGGELLDISHSMVQTVKTNVDDIADAAMNFIDTTIIPTIHSDSLPAFATEIVLENGVVAVPVTAAVNRKSEKVSDSVTKMVVQGFECCFGVDKNYRSVGMFLEKVETDSIEEVLTPFHGIKPRINSNWMSSKEDPSLSVFWKYDKTLRKEERIMSIELTLFNVEVLLNDLFGVKLESKINQHKVLLNEKKNKTSGSSTPSKLPTSPRSPRSENSKVSKESTLSIRRFAKGNTQNALLEWIEKKYKGMAVTFNISECELLAEDHLHKAQISSSSPYAKEAEGIVNGLVNELTEKRIKNQQLELLRANLLSQINQLDRQLAVSVQPPRKRASSLGRNSK